MVLSPSSLSRRVLLSMFLMGGLRDIGGLFWWTVPMLIQVAMATEDFEGSVYFGPLACNQNLATAPCRSFSNAFAAQATLSGGGATATYSQRVVVECGECYEMDHSEDYISFQDGLEVNGKLVFPDVSHGLTINTTLLAVQGQLDMHATTKAVDGQHRIMFFMVGDDDQYFEAINENLPACGRECPAGKKAFIVAGGQVNLHGLPPDTPTWLHLLDVTGASGGDDQRPTGIIVDASIHGKWAAGAEILITSHTLDMNDQQVRTIASVSQPKTMTEHGGRVVVEVQLDEPITRPTTCLDAPDFCVEVALLSRNIVFDSGKDATSDLHGGHFWVVRTPTVEQQVEGVEFRHFGQQGTVGRYPIHFHQCLEGSGSVVSKNSIRDSFQRCVVVHATDNLLVEHNVAFNTKGHCYIVEDGVEVGNTFYHNLGALTSAVVNPILGLPPSMTESDIEKPSTFWITNPSNSWIGNVAAGAEDSGFWFELIARGAYVPADFPNPKNQNIGAFIDNVAHSNTIGVRTYPKGLNPLQRGVFQGLKAYRNSKTGIFFHRVEDVLVTNSLFADNGLGLDIDRADDVQIRDTTFIGKSDSFRDLVASQAAVEDVCNRRRVTAIELHTMMDDRSEGHIMIDNVSFSGFDDTSCKESFAFRFDRNFLSGLFDLLTVIGNSRFAGDGPVANFCSAEVEGVVDVYLTDLDGGMRPASSSTTRPSTLVSHSESNNQAMMRFLDAESCIPVPDGCYSYCEDTCFTTIRFDVDPTTNPKLEICNQFSMSECIELHSIRRGDDETSAGSLRNFIAHLPAGSYTGTFLDDAGRPVWPTFVETIIEENYCGGETVVDLEAPAMRKDECSELLQNPGLEESDTEPTHWFYETGESISVAVGKGVDGSNALTGHPQDRKTQFVQFLDSRCLHLMEGETYRFRAKAKLTEDDGTTFYRCIPSEKKCPVIGLLVGDGNTETAYEIAELGESVDSKGFQVAEGKLVLNSTFTRSPRVSFYVYAWTQNLLVFLDDMSIEHVSDNPLDDPTDPPTGRPTGSPTSRPTGPPTDDPTDPPTDPPTDDPTDPPADDSPDDTPTRGSEDRDFGGFFRGFRPPRDERPRGFIEKQSKEELPPVLLDDSRGIPGEELFATGTSASSTRSKQSMFEVAFTISIGIVFLAIL